ncbi:MAG: UPF0158 family protein [Treponema sp.]|jgi:GNAT superfamily N-acetyltransferase|nr:UPF0158 family protein [Treponema sp.]
MRFELNDSLVDRIIFCMEDQNGDFVLDTHRGIVTGTDASLYEDESGGADSRFIPLPEWGPSEGFRLMERFAAGLHNLVAREELSAALDRGRGVFRAFKDALAQFPEIEKRWFAFREQGMRHEVIRWYNGLRESWGMELIGEEPEDTAALVLEDFRFRVGTAADVDAARKLHTLCLESYNGGLDDSKKTTAETLAGMCQWTFPGDLCLIAESAGGEFAACVSAAFSAPGALHIRALEVRPEYRGLGLGGTLLARLLEQADHNNIPLVSIDIPAGLDNFSRTLLRENFQSCVQRYCRKKPAP